MSRARKDPELFTIVPGDPWTINGEPTDAKTPQDAAAEVLSLATRFPVHLHVRQGENVIAVEMDRKGRTQPVQDAQPVQFIQDALQDSEEQETARQEPAASTERTVAPVVVTPAVPTVAPVASAEPAEDQEAPAQPEGADQRRRRITPMRIAGAVVLVALLGIGGALAVQGSENESVPDAAAQTPAGTEALSGWTLPSGQNVVGIIADRVITAEGTTVRFLDAETGEQVWSADDVQNAAQVRSITGTTASAVDLGDGRVAVLVGGGVSVLSGSLNARGTEPVVIMDREYTVAEGTTRPLGDAQAVLAGTAQGVVLVESPNKLVIEGAVVELAAPAADATITQAIRATDDRVVMVWSRGDTRWLTTHDLGSGGLKLQQDIGAAEVTVRSGVVWVGADQTLVGDEIRPVCDGGEQVNATIICPGTDGWESADGTQQYPERPDAISPSYTVTAGTVTKQRTHP